MLATSQVKKISQKEEAESTRDHRSQVFSVLTRAKRLSRQRSTHPELFTRLRRKPDKHSTNQENLSNATIYIHRVVYTTQMKVRTNNYSEKILITWTTHLKNKQGLDIQTKKTSTKIKDLHSRRSISILLQKLEYKG